MIESRGPEAVVAVPGPLPGPEAPAEQAVPVVPEDVGMPEDETRRDPPEPRKAERAAMKIAGLQKAREETQW